MAGLKVGVLISGRGSNLKALIDACADPDYPAEIVVVVSNRREAGGLTHAERAGIPTRIVDRHEAPDKAAFEAALDERLKEHGADFVCLAGFMQVLGDGFVARWRDRMINIHPSLLPSFRGLETHRKALEAGVRIAGCTVHFVRAAVDAGPIIVQGAVAVHPDDDEDSLAARVLAVEHRIYQLALRLIGEGRVSVVDERVVIDGAHAPDTVVISPAET